MVKKERKKNETNNTKKYGNVRIIIYTNIMMSSDEVEANFKSRSSGIIVQKDPEKVWRC